MRFIQRLGTPCCPIPSKEHFTTLQILTEMLGDYSIDQKFFHSNNGLNWIEGQDSNEQTKAIVLANDEYLFQMNITANNIYSSPADPISNDLDIEEYLSLLKNYSSIEYYYPIETLSLVGQEVHTPVYPTAIDLGLPSGTLWADMNVGATAPEEAGDYFSWGNTDAHAEGSGYDFSQATYDTTPAAAITANLSLSQDAARANLGAPWRMPTAAEFQELYDNCTCVWTTLNGVNGRLFTSNVNGNTLFFPAAGLYNGSSLSGRGPNGFYWSSSWVSAANARYLYLSPSSVSPQDSIARRFGFSLRPVQVEVVTLEKFQYTNEKWYARTNHDGTRKLPYTTKVNGSDTEIVGYGYNATGTPEPEVGNDWYPIVIDSYVTAEYESLDAYIASEEGQATLQGCGVSALVPLATATQRLAENGINITVIEPQTLFNRLFSDTNVMYLVNEEGKLVYLTEGGNPYYFLWDSVAQGYTVNNVVGQYEPGLSWGVENIGTWTHGQTTVVTVDGVAYTFTPVGNAYTLTPAAGTYGN